MRLLLSGVCALALSATAALAQEAPDSEATEEVDEIVVEADSEETAGNVEVCRQVRLTGTRFRQTVCMTRNERDEQGQNNRDVINDHRYSGAPPTETNEDGFPAVPPV